MVIIFAGAKLKEIKLSKKHFVSFCLSVVIHGIFGMYLFDFNLPKLDIPSVSIDPNKLARTRIQLDEIKFVSPESVKRHKEAHIRKNKQIVSSEKNGQKIKPMDSKFLGETDQSFGRQTIAKRNGSFKEMGLGLKSGTDDGKEILAKTARENSRDIVKNEITKNPKKIESLSMADLAIGLKNHSLQEAKEFSDKKITDSSVQDKELEKMMENSKNQALGSANGTQGKVGLSQNNDFVEEVPLGEMTQLNTQEFKYFGFYNRIKLQLEQFWGKSINEKAKALYRSGRRMPASENMITSVTVTLDDKGQIVNIKIDGSSGVRELDHAAVESFKKAGPFPNPPKGLVVDGRAVIQWGFVVRS